MKYQIISREEIEKYWETNGPLNADEYMLTEDGYVYPVGGDGQAQFVKQNFPYDPKNFPVEDDNE